MKNQHHLGKETKNASGQLVTSQFLVHYILNLANNLLGYTNGELVKGVIVWDEGLPRN